MTVMEGGGLRPHRLIHLSGSPLWLGDIVLDNVSFCDQWVTWYSIQEHRESPGTLYSVPWVTGCTVSLGASMSILASRTLYMPSWTFVCMYMCMRVWVCTDMHACVHCVHMCICIAYMCVYMHCACICVHTLHSMQSYQGSFFA